VDITELKSLLETNQKIFECANRYELQFSNIAFQCHKPTHAPLPIMDFSAALLTDHVVTPHYRSPMFTVDAHARIMSANNKAVTTFGYPKDEIVGAFLDIILDNVNEIRATMALDESAVVGMAAAPYYISLVGSFASLSTTDMYERKQGQWDMSEREQEATFVSPLILHGCRGYGQVQERRNAGVPATHGRGERGRQLHGHHHHEYVLPPMYCVCVRVRACRCSSQAICVQLLRFVAWFGLYIGVLWGAFPSSMAGDGRSYCAVANATLFMQTTSRSSSGCSRL
jgi:PAS domain-containing protein